MLSLPKARNLRLLLNWKRSDELIVYVLSGKVSQLNALPHERMTTEIRHDFLVLFSNSVPFNDLVIDVEEYKNREAHVSSYRKLCAALLSNTVHYNNCDAYTSC